MTPEQVAASYDRIAGRWLDLATYGFAQVERAVAFVKHRGVALDVGCGTGRCLGLLARHGFRTDGIDVSPAMIALARGRHPEARLVHADICTWELPRSYDLIVAWDSVWHVPLARQEAVLAKLCRGLSAGGVLVFSTGGTDGPSEKQDSCMGPPMYHAALGVPKTMHVLAGAGCVCRHLEYDQFPEDHVYLIAQKGEADTRLPVELVYHEAQPDRSSALKREAAIKAMDRREKLAMTQQKKKPARGVRQVARLEAIPNVGPAVAGDLRRLGITSPAGLPGRDPYALYDELCRITGRRHDPCVLDTFIAAVRYMEGAPKRPWWKYTAERKRVMAARTRADS